MSILTTFLLRIATGVQPACADFYASAFMVSLLVFSSSDSHYFVLIFEIGDTRNVAGV